MTLILLLLAGFSGLFAHWFKRWLRGQTEAGFIDYMSTHKRHSAASVLSLLGAIIAMVAVADVELTQQTLALAFMAGFSIDSTLNKSPDEV